LLIALGMTSCIRFILFGAIVKIPALGLESESCDRNLMQMKDGQAKESGLIPEEMCPCEWKAFTNGDCEGEGAPMESGKTYDKTWMLPYKSFQNNRKDCPLDLQMGIIDYARMSLVLTTKSYTGFLCYSLPDRAAMAIHDGETVLPKDSPCPAPPPTPAPCPSCEWKAFTNDDCAGGGVQMESGKVYDKAWMQPYLSYGNSQKDCPLEIKRGQVNMAQMNLHLVHQSYAGFRCYTLSERHASFVHDGETILPLDPPCESSKDSSLLMLNR